MNALRSLYTVCVELPLKCVIYAVLDMISTFTIKRNVKIFQKTMREGITEALVIKEEIEDEKSAKSETKAEGKKKAK